jgi:uncharacterized protein YhbP (UPF0306 family)
MARSLGLSRVRQVPIWFIIYQIINMVNELDLFKNMQYKNGKNVKRIVNFT